MKRHAYLIMAYNNWNQLATLLSLLDDPQNDLFLHIDANVKSFPVEKLKLSVHQSTLYFIPRRKVYWADFSQSEAELDLMSYASEKASYHYYHLISGQCLPLKTQKEIHDFFENEDHEFLAMSRDGGEYARRYVNYYHLLLHCKVYRNSKILKGLDRIFMYAQKLFHVNRLKNRNITLSTGWTWFSITDDFCRYVVSKREEISQVYCHTIASDEQFLGTIARNSEFFTRVFLVADGGKNTNRQYMDGCLRMVDWNRGKPYTWGIDSANEDYQLLINSKYLFARKFDEKLNSEIITQIVNYLRKKQEDEKHND